MSIRKAKIKAICFFMIISLFLSLIFPWVTKANNSNSTNENNLDNSHNDFSIQIYSANCPEEQTVKLGEDDLFCVIDTEYKLPDENLENRKEALKFEAKNFTRSIKKFAETKKDKNELIFDPDCESKSNCLTAAPNKRNYYFLQIIYKNSDDYFSGDLKINLITIGKKSNLSITEEWKKNKDEWQKKVNDIKTEIQNAIKNYDSSPKLNLNRNEQQSLLNDDKSLKLQELTNEVQELSKKLQILVSQIPDRSEENTEKLELSNQAVLISGKEGTKPIFYIRTWNKGLSPSERARRVSNKIQKIVEGKINIQGLGIFEQSTKNIEAEYATNEKSKIIKIVSDSKFLSEADKKILEVTYYDALFEGKDNAADLAQEYLIKINSEVNKYKSETGVLKDKGYSVSFLGKYLFSINNGRGFSQASYRASEISNKIEQFAKKSLFLNSDRLIVAYPVEEGLNSQNNQDKGLCILPESLNIKDYQKFLTNDNSDYKNEDVCQIESLEKNKYLAIVYSDEITQKINRGDWQLTNSDVKTNLSEGFPPTIAFMQLKNDYKRIMVIQDNELDSLLHKDYNTRQELAIYFLNQIKNDVTAYTSQKRTWLVICIILLIAIFQLVFRVSSSINKAGFAIKSVLGEEVSVVFFSLRSYIYKKTAKIVNYLHPDNKTYYSITLKLALLSGVIIFALYNIPIINIFIFDFRKILSRFIDDQQNIIFSYIYTEVPRIIFILIFIFILHKIATVYVSKIENNAVKKGEKTLAKSNLIIFRILLVIFTVIFISPHLPAAGTIYFKGISAFAVLAFTWSASSVIYDFVSGIILIYFTSLKTGDWIEVGDTIGEIKEQNLFFHRIKTSKNWVKTMPNSFILSNCTTNLTTSCKQKSKLILHVPVGLGYDVPRELVENVLILAALKTKNVFLDMIYFEKYQPFVLITNLGDFAITYELNVYTENPELITKIYSDLQKNIQDECGLRGIEILSPNYSTLRFDEEDKVIRQL